MLTQQKSLSIDESRDDDDDDDDDHEVHASAATKGSLISEKEAIAIAKKNIPGEVVEIELDEDDGRYEYEIELKDSTMARQKSRLMLKVGKL